MPGVIPLVSSPHGGMQVFAQAQQPACGLKRRSGGDSSSEQVDKKRRGPRRPQFDYWPAPRGNEEYDVQRLWDWVNRGACQPRQRKIDFRGRRVDVAEAFEILQREKARLHATMQVPGPAYRVPVTVPQALGCLHGTQQHFDTTALMPGVIPGFPMGLPPFMPQQPGPFPAQHLGFQQPQALIPACQTPPLAMSQPGDHLPFWGWHFNPAVPTPEPSSIDPNEGIFDFTGGFEGLQDQSFEVSGDLNGVVDPAGAVPVAENLGEATQEWTENLQGLTTDGDVAAWMATVDERVVTFEEEGAQVPAVGEEIGTLQAQPTVGQDYVNCAVDVAPSEGIQQGVEDAEEQALGANALQEMEGNFFSEFNPEY